MSLWLLTIFACGLNSPSSPVLTTPSQTGPATAPPARTVTAIALARNPDAIDTLTLPYSNRPKKEAAPDKFGLIAPREYRGRHGAADLYATPLPIHSNLMPTKSEGTHHFGSAPPPGLRVTLGDKYLNFARGGEAPNSYGFSRDELFIGLSKDSPAPDWKDVSITFPKATTHENALNLGKGKADPREFATRNFTLDAISYTGLFLPAPTTASWSIPLPERAVLTFRGTIMPPAIRSVDRTDGASVLLRVLDGENELASHVVDLKLKRWQDVRWDLAEHAGKAVTLEIATEPGITPLFDYVFLEDPVVYTPSEKPSRTVLVFIDTLRPDHLGTYGYKRNTSPAITAWSEHAAVFENARSVAPWTLPSARTALSGQQPEDWYDHPNLAERFSEAGFRAEAIVADAFLSQPFDMHRGFSRFQYEHLMTAGEVSRAATDVFENYPDRDVFLMVHYIDPHLPYEEGLSYQYLWARIPPDVRMSRVALMEVNKDDANYQAVRDYTIARYDQNIRYVDDSLVPVLDAAGLDATVVLFSDHGEEFWDHDSFEHGHTLYDELLHVPMIVRSPHVPPGRYDAPVSLLDIAPTALALEGLDPADGPGVSLVDSVHGVSGAEKELRDRPQAFGRPLYNNDGWAVLEQGQKWINRDGVQIVHDIASDPAELKNVAEQAQL
ncbi:MAG: sulfatase-like hydrolase/transferase, partial [Rhodobacterales bacterium]|nr:sulfatase-like hydrolase/transferase [Rhodobacterales bacterium]